MVSDTSEENIISSRIFGKIDDILTAAASSAGFRRFVRAAVSRLPNAEMAVVTPEGPLVTASPDRFLAALLWKYRYRHTLEYRVYEASIRPGMTVIDVGANIGFTALMFSRLAGPGGRVVALEADNDNFLLLKRNTAGRTNIDPRRCAVSDKDGVLRLYRSEEHRGDHRVFDSGDARPSVTVPAASLDSLLGPGARADFIKMDIQGAEYPALRGMRGLVRNSPGLKMLCEFSPSLLLQAGSSPDLLLAELSDLGFSLSYLDEASSAVRPASPAGLTALCPGDGYLNLLLERA